MPFRLCSGQQRRGELFVELEEVFHALAVAGEGFLAPRTVATAVEVSVGFGEREQYSGQVSA